MVSTELGIGPKQWIQEKLTALGAAPSPDWDTKESWYKLGWYQFNLMYLWDRSSFEGSFHDIAVFDGPDNEITLKLCQVASTSCL